MLVLAFGGNVGDVQSTFDLALKEVEEQLGPLIRRSHLYKSEPWGFSEQPWFINMIAEFRTSLSPIECLDKCQAIEKINGRVRKTNQYAERTLDLDILFFDQIVMETDRLTIPHPKIATRRFILVPLCETWPTLRHPKAECSVNELMTNCTDPLQVVRI